MDDPLSAVDAHVGRHLMSECVRGLLDGKTRLLVTHQLQFLPEADVVIKMEAGRIVAMGPYTQLQQEGVTFAEFKMEAAEGGDVEEGGSEGAASSGTGGGVDENVSVNVDGAKGVPDKAAGGGVQEIGEAKRSASGAEKKGGQGEQQVRSGVAPHFWTVYGRDAALGCLVCGRGLTARPQHRRWLLSIPACTGHVLCAELVSWGTVSMRPGFMLQPLPEVTAGARAWQGVLVRVTATGVDVQAPKQGKSKGALTQQEDRSKGSVARSVYMTYLRAWGPGLLLPCAFLAVALCERGLQVRHTHWMSLESIVVGFGSVSSAPHCFLQLSSASTVCCIARCVGLWVLLDPFCLLRVTPTGSVALTFWPIH